MPAPEARFDPRGEPRADPRSRQTVQAHIVAHLRELLRQAEAGELDCVLVTARRTGARIWTARSFGLVTDEVVRDIPRASPASSAARRRR